MKFTDDAGKTLSQESRSFLGLKELNTVVVQGRIHREGEGAFSIAADGVFLKKK